MFWQYIIVFAIIGAAASITIYRLYRFFKNPLDHCSKCALHGEGVGCGLKELKYGITAKK
jgi:hypothetical protein